MPKKRPAKKYDDVEPKKKLPKTDSDDSESTLEDESLNGLNSPDVDEETGEVQNRAVSDYKQAHAICKRQYDKAEDGRLKVAAMIADKYAGSAPFRQSDLSKIGEDWRNNFSTNPLASVVDRSTPQLKDPIKEADTLTFSSLPPQRQDAAEKTRKFRVRVTSLVRAWSAWEDFIDQITQDNYLYGNTAPGWIDDDWRPRAWRYNEVFLPEGTSQHASQTQFAVFRQPMLLHDFLKRIEDKETSEDAGYDWDGCVKAANEAGGLRNQGNDLSHFEQVDLMREGSLLGHTYDGETKVVWMFHLLVREYDGGVSIWTTSQKGGHAIRKQENVFETMEDACTLFSLQAGNNRLYGSKGAGRMLTNLHIALDRLRCQNADLGYVAGMPIMYVKSKGINSVQTHVRTPFMFVEGDVEMLKGMVTFDAQTADYLDDKMMKLMEAVAGSFIPPNLDNEGAANTKIEAAQDASAKLAVRNGVLGRFFRQFGDLMSSMQRKIFSKENLKEGLRIFQEQQEDQLEGKQIISQKLYDLLDGIVDYLDEEFQPMPKSKLCDPEAVEAIVDLLNDELTIQDIAELALSPAGNSDQDDPTEQDQKVSAFIGAIKGGEGPLASLGGYYDSQECATMIGKIQVGEDIAQQLALKKPDPSDQARNTREELQEFHAIAMEGDPLPPPASDDNHAVRRLVLASKLQPIIQTLGVSPTQQLLSVAQNTVQHYELHLQADVQAKQITPEQLQSEKQAVDMMQDTIKKAEQMLAAMAKKAAAAGVQGGPGSIPAPLTQNGGQPVMPPQQNLEHAKLLSENARTGAQLAVDTANIKLEHRKLDIKQQELAQKDHQHTLDTATDVAQNIANQGAQAHMQGIDAAQNQAQQDAQSALQQSQFEATQNQQAQQNAQANAQQNQPPSP